MSPHFLSTYLLSFPFLFLSSSLSASLVWIAFGKQCRRTRDGDERWSQIYGWVDWKRDLGFLGEGLGQQRKLLQGQSHLVLFWPPGTLCACVCVCYCITTIASMSLSSSDRVFCRWEDFLLYFWQWLNRSKQVCLCLWFSLTFLQKCRTEITNKRSGLLF